ncbi:MAG: hybrid sensor histidine kinase/response regulator [Candidatus Latescibacterota bacterium]|nr:MAG: hybrid sensor histidine kinase/response regulator [Candidatus Latescibacterota bacterium]
MGDPTTILIVDDEEIVLRSCRRVLKDSGYEIETAASGEEAEEKLRERRRDIVVTDLKMPGMGGIELLKRIKERTPEQVVIVFTGYANVATARESLKLGAFDYVPKPFTPDELRDVLANAAKSLCEKGPAKMLDLMAIVAHEFKSPVATVHTTVETLYGGYFGELNEQQRHGLETIMRNCQYLEDILRSSIDLAKMEWNDLEIRKEKVRLVPDVIQPVLDTPEYRTNLKKMRLVPKLGDVRELTGDPNLLRIVVGNLVNNAVKYGRPSTDIEIEAREEAEHAVLSVRNEGAGISREDIEGRLFKRFERLKQKGTEGVKGSGLGLYICRQIVERHGGRIEVDSEVGRYARFVVRLPVDPA